jgi:hypothetical protein
MFPNAAASSTTRTSTVPFRARVQYAALLSAAPDDPGAGAVRLRLVELAHR